MCSLETESYGSSILIKKVAENDKETIRFDKNQFFDNSSSIGVTGKQYQLFETSSQGMTKLFKFSFKNNNDGNNNSIYKYNLGELESIKNAERNWKYLLKSRYQEFLMISSTSDIQNIQNIELYNIDTSQLVNVFRRRRRGNDFLISRNNDPRNFAVTIDSRLFAYSYGDNTIIICLMESGLEIVSKSFDDIYNIKYLEFIEKDQKLFIIKKDKG
ncbi:hypothetical protein C1645_818202 [Glomus cerebriforme]|uniref:Uncharacterized protein n=1 Tax=Glomus cerebriforme TaxID=658196 RepID=A0A397TH29_9GLOM|nr:hypothetical protein C1645_818202 [Glomus cerebriforme]